MDCAICFGVNNIYKLEWQTIILAITLPALPGQGAHWYSSHMPLYCQQRAWKQKILRGKWPHNVWCSFSALIASVDFDEVFIHLLPTFPGIATFNKARSEGWFASFFYPHLRVNEKGVDRIMVSTYYFLHVAMLLLSRLRRKSYENFSENFSLNLVTQGNLDTKKQTKQTE